MKPVLYSMKKFVPLNNQPYDRVGWFYTKGKAEASAKRMSRKGYHYRIVHAKGYYWLYVRK
ncbi:MAG: hypothetical protein ACXQT3_02180 [Methermicoccaceae archaeon]